MAKLDIAPDKQWLYTSHKKRLQQKRAEASKQFDVKRDKGGKGFSMVIGKKIKGFEETDMAGERIDELSKSTLKSAQKGFAKRIATSAKAGDEKKVEKDVGNIAKAGHRLAGRYYPKYVKEKNPTFGGHRKYKASTSPYTGKEPEARYTRKEEYEMSENEDPEANFNEIENDEQEQEEEEEEEGGEQEIVEPNVSDLVLNAIEQKPLDFQQTFADLMQQRIEDAVAERKLEVAAAFTGADDRSQYEAGEDEPEGEEEEEEVEVEEEPEAEAEEGTEEEE